MGTQKRVTVSIQELTHTRRFKYRCNGKEYYLTLPKKGVLSGSAEQQIAKYIELDILRNAHDDTLRSYKEMIVLGGIPGTSNTTSKPKSEKFIMHEALKDYYLKTGRNIGKNFYRAAYFMVKKWGDRTTIDMIPQKLAGMNYASDTFNNRKGILNGFCDWLVRNGRLKYNPVYDIPSRKRSGSKTNVRKRLTDTEIRLILESVRTDRFLNKYCYRWTHSHYYPILAFMAHTGVRPAEAIGLQVKKINFTSKIITIDQALARAISGTSAAFRTMKSTKMNDSRELPFNSNPDLESILLRQCQNRTPEDLVFPGPTGLSCDDRKINDNVLVPVMEGLGIERRILYAFRHSFASRCFERGMDIKTVQSLTGHKDASVLLNTYAEVSKTRISVPNIL